jgi:uncharacterized protein YkwD
MLPTGDPYAAVVGTTRTFAGRSSFHHLRAPSFLRKILFVDRSIDRSIHPNSAMFASTTRSSSSQQARRGGGPPHHHLRKQRRSPLRGELSTFLEPIPEDASKDFALLDEDETIIMMSSPRTVVQSIAAVGESNRHDDTDDDDDEEEVSSLLLLDLDQLVLVNQDRRFHLLPPYRSSDVLDQLAARHAIAMARAQSVFHSVQTIAELMERLQNDRVAENIQRGDGIVQMHEDTMNYSTSSPPCINRTNILSGSFNEFGSAVALGGDRKLYSCQLFRTSQHEEYGYI